MDNKFKKINLNIINKKSEEIWKLNSRSKQIKYFRKIGLYAMGIGLSLFYFVYLIKSSSLLEKLELNKKFTNRKKKIEEGHGIDSKQNEEKLIQFKDKWGIGSAEEKYQENLKYGNKILNKKEEIKENSIQIEVNKEGKIQEEINTLPQSNPLNIESNVFFDSPLQIKKP